MLYIAAVLYNKRISDIASLENMFSFTDSIGNENVKLIVVDNSEAGAVMSLEDETIIKNHDIVYISNGNNLGLSKAYNIALKYALDDCKKPEGDYLLLVDDDTPFSKEYFSKIYEETICSDRSSDGVNVITGIISSGGKSMSPTKGFRFRFTQNDYINKPGIYENISCISSGMAVRLKALKSINGFEESLFLDMIDYTMLYRLSEKKLCRVLVTDVKAVQNFSGRDEKDKKVLRNRFKIYKKDFSTYCDIVGKSTFYKYAHLLKRRISIER